MKTDLAVPTLASHDHGRSRGSYHSAKAVPAAGHLAVTMPSGGQVASVSEAVYALRFSLSSPFPFGSNGGGRATQAPSATRHWRAALGLGRTGPLAQRNSW